MRVLVLAFVLFLPSLSFSQTDATGFFKQDAKVVWYGFDFSHAKYIGAMSNGAQQSFSTSREFKYLVAPFLNGLVINEAYKYDLQTVFYKDQVTVDTSFVNQANRTIDEKNFQTYDNIEYKINPDQFSDLISAYSIPSGEGFGIVVFVENLNKIKNLASFYITVFDNTTKQILFVQQIEGRMLGGGFKNYCAGSIKYAFDEIKKNHYSTWKKKYSKK
jgi:hypothetical protein